MKMRASWFLAAALGAGAIVAVVWNPGPSGPTSATPTAVPDPATDPAIAQPAPTATAPTQDGARPGNAAPSLAGTVREVLQVDSYTYLRIARGKTEFWAAVPTASVEVGQSVSITQATRMTDFPSRSLSRTFEQIYFGRLGAPGEKTAAGPKTAPKAAAATPVELGPGAVPRATGANAFTVAELYGKAAELKGKNVRVSARIMRVTPNVLGRTWLRVQDGSGSQAEKNHELVVTTTETPENGVDVVIVGVLAVDRDLGAGYRYPVVIEEATFEPLARK